MIKSNFNILYMGMHMPFVDILIFAVIAVFLIFRLKSILGRRDGFEQDTNAMSQQQPASAQAKIVPFQPQSHNGVGLDAVRNADRSFSDDQFKQGAASAFGMILTAFSEGDLATLRRLLGYDLYQDFSESIRLRNQDEEQLELTIHEISDVVLTDGEVSENIASVTVKFTSVQTRTLKNKAGDILEDETETEISMQDIWVFERDVQLDDPNWKLVETRAGDDD